MSGGSAPIEVFKLGRHTDVSGQVITFGQADAEGLIAAYDRETAPAPLVVGHPELDSPAWGWASGFKLQGDILVAEPEQVDPAFAEAVNAGRYKRVSLELYRPTSPHNPKPGHWYPKHIGFLGGAAPAIKGLKTVAFAAGVEPGECARFEFAIPTTTTQETKMSGQDDTARFAEQQAQIERDREQLRQDREALATERANARRDGFVAFAEEQVGKGLLAPGKKDGAVFLMERLAAADAAATVKFGEGDKQQTGVELFRSLFSDAKPIVSFGEFAPGTGGKSGESESTVRFAAPPGYAVDPAQSALYARAKALQAVNPKLSITEAVAQLQG